MKTITIRWQASRYDRFAPGCLDGEEGKVIRFGGVPASLVSYVVAPDGSWMDLVLRVAGEPHWDDDDD